MIEQFTQPVGQLHYETTLDTRYSSYWMKCIDRCLNFVDLHYSHKIGYYILLKSKVHQSDHPMASNIGRHQKALEYTASVTQHLAVDIWCEAIDMGYDYESTKSDIESKTIDAKLDGQSSDDTVIDSYTYIDSDPLMYTLYRECMLAAKQRSDEYSFEFISTCYSLYRMINASTGES